MKLEPTVWIDILNRLKANDPSLEHLNLKNRELGDEAVLQLAQVLKQNQTLLSLNLANNGISETGMKALAQVLLANLTLKQLDLNFNEINNKVCAEFDKALRVNATILCLQLHNTIHAIDNCYIASLHKQLELNQQLQRLDFFKPMLTMSNQSSDIVDCTIPANSVLQNEFMAKQKLMNFLFHLLEHSKNIHRLILEYPRCTFEPSFFLLTKMQAGFLKHIHQLEFKPTPFVQPLKQFQKYLCEAIQANSNLISIIIPSSWKLPEGERVTIEADYAPYLYANRLRAKDALINLLIETIRGYYQSTCNLAVLPQDILKIILKDCSQMYDYSETRQMDTINCLLQNLKFDENGQRHWSQFLRKDGGLLQIFQNRNTFFTPAQDHLNNPVETKQNYPHHSI